MRAPLLGLLLMIASGPTNAGEANERVLTDFSASSADLGWHVVNDDVMGGRSAGDFRIEGGRLVFAGRTNTNGGGFSSLRTRPAPVDLSAFDGVRLWVRGDGRRYTWRLTTNAHHAGIPIAYWADFETRTGEWQTVDVPFSRFVPRVRGTTLAGPPLSLDAITSMGLMIFDKRDGPFEIALRSVKAYAARDTFSFAPYRGTKRVLVVSAPASHSAALREQLNAVEASRAAFEERDLLLVTLSDDGAAAAGDQRLSAHDVAAARAALALRPDAFAVRLLGKDGGIKWESDAPVAVDELYALIDGMPMRQREMTER